jgi:hypothetical protein
VSKIVKRKGMHPSADKRFRPRGAKLDSVREALEPFGLSKNDDKTWLSLEPVFVALAYGYNFRRTPGAIPRPGGVRSSFDNVEQAFGDLKKAAAAFLESIGAIDYVALEWMLAYDDPVPLFARNRSGADGPSMAPENFKELVEIVFRPELEDWHRLTNQQRTEFISNAQPLVERLGAAVEDQRAATLQHIRSIARQLPGLFFPTAGHSVAPTVSDGTDRTVEQELSEKTRTIAAARLRIGKFIPPSPHFASDGLRGRVRGDLDEMIRRFAPIVELATQARQRFDVASPTDKGGNNLTSFLSGKSPSKGLLRSAVTLFFPSSERPV